MSIDTLLKQIHLYTDDVAYQLIKLPPFAITVAAGILAEIGEPFSTLIVDKDEVTLVIRADSVEDYAPRLRDYHLSENRYRLITFDMVLDFSVVGLMAHISRILADATISILPIASFSRDHVLVSEQDFDKAWQVLSAITATKV